MRRLDDLRRIGDDPDQRNKDNEALIWYLLKPVRKNFEHILLTTKENVKSKKDRAAIFGDELLAIGEFLDGNFSVADQSMKKRFW